MQRDLIPELHQFRIESTGQCRDSSALFLRIDRFCAELRDRATCEDRKQLGEDRLRRGASSHECARGSNQLLTILREQRLDERRHIIKADAAKHAGHAFFGDAPAAVGNGLIEQRQGITRAALRAFRKQIERGGLGLDTLLGKHMRQMSRDLHPRKPGKIELQAARENRDREFFRFSGRKQKFDVRRRLLERLQQGVEGMIGEHVHFVDQIDLEAPGSCGELHVIQQIAGIVDLGT